ncbi:MAG: hypothetical protein KC733_01960, partial [Candidatus Omnitrophica bacterium]|nr:hypothetical protein [Candidatus Omnitrophota bacterium]
NQTIEDLLKNKYKLSPREIEITKLLARGILTNKLIAQDVRIEESTVGSHIGDISGKMKIDDPFYAIVSIVSIVNEYMRKAEGFLREVYRDDLYKYFGIELGYQEFDVFKKIVDGHTDYEIINELNLKQKKLDSILNELYRKMEITNQFRDQRRRASLVIKYFQYVRMLDEKIKLELQARTKYAKLDIPFPKVEKNYKKGLDVGFEKSLNDTKQWLEKEFGFENEIIDIVLFIASGLDNKTIAKRLAENEKIVAGKRREIYKKMKVSVSTQVTSVVYQNPYARNLLNKLDYVDIKTKLNDSEYQTLEGMAKGMDLLSIARTSGRTLRDVVKEVKEIRRKLGVKRNNIEAVKLYYRYQFDQSSSALESTDEAQAVGGIDLNTELLKLETEGEAIEFELPDELRNIDINAINGFTPIIQQMIPVTNLYMLLGSGEEREKGDTQDISFNRSIDPFVTKKRF